MVLQLGSAHPSAIALEAAVRIARAFQSEIESLFVEDAQLFDCAAYGFVREVSLTGRQRRVMSAAGMTRDLRLAAQAARRQLEALARRAEVPLRSRVVRDEPLRALVDRLRRVRARGTWWRWPSRSPAATAARSSSC